MPDQRLILVVLDPHGMWPILAAIVRPRHKPGHQGNSSPRTLLDDKEVANRKVPHTIPFIVTFEETFDVGVKMRSGG